MQGIRELKRRIKSIRNTQQITKAMHMVAAAKLRRARERAENFRPYINAIRDLLVDVAAELSEAGHPLVKSRKVNKAAYIVITGDRGLSGGYNISVIKEALNHKRKDDAEKAFIAVGQKGKNYFRRKGYALLGEFSYIDEEISRSDARVIASSVFQLYEQNTVEEVNLVYTEFVTTLQQSPKVIKILPVDLPEKGKETPEGKPSGIYLYEPSVEEILDKLIPSYITSQLYAALLEAKASELAARMAAMDSATQNAEKLIDELSLTYNRARQAGITKEISEVVGGAEALREK
ncbi:MAG: F-type H+-transporting ATPase subunit gamma [Thermosediminibacterales bacterium]|nr:F-type H+-transporting ATPase subunit gamma [Thermosediminibacterales bacterium]MDK2836001.1 F-type H+-transporting ATPase subunit gamma [Thermosediminibacterales bacterium]